MKHKVSKLEGALLDAAVAKAEGRAFELLSQRVWGDGSLVIVDERPACRVGVDYFDPSTKWEHGGPIIERERIAVLPSVPGWEAFSSAHLSPRLKDAVGVFGPTYLIAAMRAYVASKLGEEIELP